VPGAEIHQLTGSKSGSGDGAPELPRSHQRHRDGKDKQYRGIAFILIWGLTGGHKCGSFFKTDEAGVKPPPAAQRAGAGENRPVMGWTNGPLRAERKSRRLKYPPPRRQRYRAKGVMAPCREDAIEQSGINQGGTAGREPALARAGFFDPGRTLEALFISADK